MHVLVECGETGLLTPGVIGESRCEKTGPRGFRPGPTQTGLYNYINGERLEISDLDRSGILLSILRKQRR